MSGSPSARSWRRSRARRGISLVALVCWGVALACGAGAERRAWRGRGGAGPPPAAVLHEVEVDGVQRSYELHVPSAAGDGPLPLMVVLHGGLGNSVAARRTTGMDAVADAGSFLVAYPNGTGGSLGKQERRTWNAGRCCGRGSRERVDDVGFVARMLDDVARRHPVDAERVYVLGYSNGGMMAYRVACEIPERVAAVVVVSGALMIDRCDAGRDVPVFHVHGDADPNVPYRGGEGKFVRVTYPSVQATIETLARPRACGRPSESEDSGDRVTRYACTRGAPIVLRTLVGGGHRWPDGSAAFRGFSAATAAWEFARPFRRQPVPRP